MRCRGFTFGVHNLGSTAADEATSSGFVRLSFSNVNTVLNVACRSADQAGSTTTVSLSTGLFLANLYPCLHRLTLLVCSGFELDWGWRPIVAQ